MTKVEPMPFQTYLSMVENSVGSKTFSHGYAQVDGQPTDVMRVGELSCAFFVSSLLKIFDVIGSMHATVASTVKDLEESSWHKVNSAEPGDVIVWKPILFPGGERHEHIGFALTDSQAVSNDYKSGSPQKHDLLSTPDGTTRQIETIYRGRHLFESKA